MAGTCHGFGTTYFGGNRDPGPFDLDAKKNDVWEAQLGHVRRVFLPIQWWKLQPHDELLACAVPCGKEGKGLAAHAPGAVVLAVERQYVLYAESFHRSHAKLDPPSGLFSACSSTHFQAEGFRRGFWQKYSSSPARRADQVVLLTAASK
jgi:hypothetical protein